MNDKKKSKPTLFIGVLDAIARMKNTKTELKRWKQACERIVGHLGINRYDVIGETRTLRAMLYGDINLFERALDEWDNTDQQEIAKAEEDMKKADDEKHTHYERCFDGRWKRAIKEFCQHVDNNSHNNHDSNNYDSNDKDTRIKIIDTHNDKIGNDCWKALLDGDLDALENVLKIKSNTFTCITLPRKL